MLFTIISIGFISIMGTLLHFLYDITNHNKIIGLFSAVNESTWEHIKIALTPTILWSLVDGILYGQNNNYFFAKFLSLIIIIVLIPTLYYGYKKVLKKENFILDISIFYLSIICSQITFNVILDIENISNFTKYLSYLGLAVIFGCYMILTLMPIKNFLFKDPITKKYGFDRHNKNDNN